MGAIYGALVEQLDGPLLTGAGFGTALWLAADELAVPLLRLSRAPSHRTAEMHLQAFAAHIVYGVTAELVRRRIRAGK
jgi:putative membrane protein